MPEDERVVERGTYEETAAERPPGDEPGVIANEGGDPMVAREMEAEREHLEAQPAPQPEPLAQPDSTP